MSVPSFGYLRCYKSDFDVVKAIIGLLNELIKNSYFCALPLRFSSPLSSSSSFWLSQVFKVNFDAVWSTQSLDEDDDTSFCVHFPPVSITPSVSVHGENSCECSEQAFRRS